MNILRPIPSDERIRRGLVAVCLGLPFLIVALSYLWLARAYAAADCLALDWFDEAKWSRYRRDFEKHVVVD